MKRTSSLFVFVAFIFAFFAVTGNAQISAGWEDGMAETMFAFDDLVLTPMQTFFTAVTAMCIIVTGFFLGRKWLRQVG